MAVTLVVNGEDVGVFPPGGPDPTIDVAELPPLDLSCGRLTIYAGDFAPSGPAPLPSAGSPGDCAP